MNGDIPGTVWSGTFTICGVELKCHTLADGTRIIEEDSMRDFFENLFDGTLTAADVQSDPDIDAFKAWRHGK